MNVYISKWLNEGKIYRILVSSAESEDQAKNKAGFYFGTKSGAEHVLTVEATVDKLVLFIRDMQVEHARVGIDWQKVNKTWVASLYNDSKEKHVAL